MGKRGKRVLCILGLIAVGIAVCVAAFLGYYEGNERKAVQIAKGYLEQKYEQEMIYQGVRHAWIDPDVLRNYNPLSYPNTRLQTLMKEAFSGPTERLLWIPPCMPCYTLSGDYNKVIDMSKILVFSPVMGMPFDTVFTTMLPIFMLNGIDPRPPLFETVVVIFPFDQVTYLGRVDNCAAVFVIEIVTASLEGAVVPFGKLNTNVAIL